MPCRIGILKETYTDERRVALVPSIVDKYAKLGAELVLERHAGDAAFRADGDYEAKGVAMADSPARIFAECDVILKVQPPSIAEIEQMRPKTVVLGYMNPHRHPEYALAMRDADITSFAMELLPRITRAQSMDALTSQAAVAGYKARPHGGRPAGRLLPHADPPGRHHPADQGPGPGRRRSRSPGHRHGQAPGRDRGGLRRAPGHRASRCSRWGPSSSRWS